MIFAYSCFPLQSAFRNPISMTRAFPFYHPLTPPSHTHTHTKTPVYLIRHNFPQMSLESSQQVPPATPNIIDCIYWIEFKPPLPPPQFEIPYDPAGTFRQYLERSIHPPTYSPLTNNDLHMNILYMHRCNEIRKLGSTHPVVTVVHAGSWSREGAEGEERGRHTAGTGTPALCALIVASISAHKSLMSGRRRRRRRRRLFLFFWPVAFHLISAPWSCPPRLSSSFRWLRDRDTNSSAFTPLSNERRWRRRLQVACKSLNDECGVHQAQFDYDT